jgi:hypothetical protein
MSKKTQLQAILDMQNDNATLKITLGQEDIIKEIDSDVSYIDCLLNNINNPTEGLSMLAEYNDLEMEDYFLD